MNGGSANGNAFVDWRTKCTGVLNHHISVPSLKARACARDPTTIVVIKTLLLLPSFPGPEAGARDKLRGISLIFLKEDIII